MAAPRKPRLLSLASLSIAALSAFACGGSHGPDDEPIATVEISSMRVLPEDAVVNVVNGETDPLAFELEVSYDDGTVVIADSATWSVNGGLIGGIDANGSFLASGTAAGIAEIRASFDGQVATTTVAVEVLEEINVSEFATDIIDSFADDPIVGDKLSPDLLYPLDGAVIPSSLGPMQVQWEDGLKADIAEPGDAYRVVMTSGLATVHAYVGPSGPDFDYAWLADAEAWSLLRETAAQSTTPIDIRVDRLDAFSGDTFASETRAIKQVDADLSGAIYYWDLSQGKILRIADGGRDNPIPFPPIQPPELDPKPDGQGGSRCIACHTMSRDGRYMAVQMWGGGGYNTVFDLTEDLTQDPAPTNFEPGEYQANFQTFNPEATRLLVNYRIPGGVSTGYFELRDPFTGEALPTQGEPLPSTGASHPTWSPDGTMIAYAGNHNGTSNSINYTESDLAVIPVTGEDTFGASQTLRAAEGKANSWPTFSPDSEWIAYGRGVHSRGRTVDKDTGELIIYPGNLRMINRDGGDEIVLAKASGDGNDSHLPNFSPFQSGGYYWMIFYSTRDYGNEQAGTKGQDRRQMWITAIDMNVRPGEDPSSVPFWLPGQKVESHNMSAYWTLPPPAPIQ